MNRIREIRERHGLSAAQLAERVGTTQPQITRLERGERRLTVDWMQRIAAALNCDPMDLVAATLAKASGDEAVPFSPPEIGAAAAALSARGLKFFKASADTLEAINIAPGRVLLFDTSDAAVSSARTGDVVLARLKATNGIANATTLLRQFISPHLLTTNRHNRNVLIPVRSPDAEATIIGVLVPDEKADD